MARRNEDESESRGSESSVRRITVVEYPLNGTFQKQR
jgi:hypothetical protein